MRTYLHRFSPVLLMLALMISPIACSNNPSTSHTLSAASLPDGFEGFNEARVYAQYTDIVNGYDVKVMILPEYRTWRGTCRAIINFSNDEGNYKIVHDGWVDSLWYDEATQVLHLPNNEVISLTYKRPRVSANESFMMDVFANLPFVFYDIDFDGNDELIIKLANQGQRWINAYEVIEMEPDRLYSIYRKPPFTELDDCTIIDPLNHTITISSYEGHGEELRTVYKISEDEYSLSPKVTEEYTDDMWFWGVDGDETPVYRRIYTHELNDTTGWRPIPEKQ